MDFNKYQHLAARTINPMLGVLEEEMHAVHLIAAECGEIHSIYQKRYQGHDFDPNHLKKELGDLLWGIAELCTNYGWPMDEVAELNIEKLKERYPDGFEAERSLHRQEGDV